MSAATPGRWHEPDRWYLSAHGQRTVMSTRCEVGAPGQAATTSIMASTMVSSSLRTNNSGMGRSMSAHAPSRSTAARNVAISARWGRSRAGPASHMKGWVRCSHISFPQTSPSSARGMRQVVPAAARKAPMRARSAVSQCVFENRHASFVGTTVQELPEPGPPAESIAMRSCAERARTRRVARRASKPL